MARWSWWPAGLESCRCARSFVNGRRRTNTGGARCCTSSLSSDVIYREELSRLDGANLSVHLALTREWPPDWTGHRGRIDQQLLAGVIPQLTQRPLVYVCGPTSFVETVAHAFVEIGIEPGRIKTERFGATGT